VGIITVPAGVRSLGAGREVFWREAGVGVSRLAYYLGRIITDAPKIVLLAFFFTAPLVAIAPWRAPVESALHSVGSFLVWELSRPALAPVQCFMPRF